MTKLNISAIPQNTDQFIVINTPNSKAVMVSPDFQWWDMRGMCSAYGEKTYDFLSQVGTQRFIEQTLSLLNMEYDAMFMEGRRNGSAGIGPLITHRTIARRCATWLGEDCEEWFDNILKAANSAQTQVVQQPQQKVPALSQTLSSPPEFNAWAQSAMAIISGMIELNSVTKQIASSASQTAETVQYIREELGELGQTVATVGQALTDELRNGPGRRVMEPRRVFKGRMIPDRWEGDPSTMPYGTELKDYFKLGVEWLVARWNVRARDIYTELYYAYDDMYGFNTKVTHRGFERQFPGASKINMFMDLGRARELCMLFRERYADGLRRPEMQTRSMDSQATNRQDLTPINERTGMPLGQWGNMPVRQNRRNRRVEEMADVAANNVEAKRRRVPNEQRDSALGDDYIATLETGLAGAQAEVLNNPPANNNGAWVALQQNDMAEKG